MTTEVYKSTEHCTCGSGSFAVTHEDKEESSELSPQGSR